MATPTAANASTSGKLTEDLANFLTREKRAAENCMRDCERLLNNPDLLSSSLREGLASIRTNSEDTYGTLLHLERVMRMKSKGTTASPVAKAKAPATMAMSVPVGTGASFPRKSENAKKGARMRIGSGDGPDYENSSREDIFDEDFDPLRDELFERQAHNNGREHRDRGTSATSEDSDQFDEESGLTTAAYKARRPNKTLTMARSLPMPMPMAELRAHLRSSPEGKEQPEDIPRKIAEIAKSLHTNILGDLPSPPRYRQKVVD